MHKKFDFWEHFSIRKKSVMGENFFNWKKIKNSEAEENFSIQKKIHIKFNVRENFSIRKTFVMGENFFNGKKV